MWICNPWGNRLHLPAFYCRYQVQVFFTLFIPFEFYWWGFIRRKLSSVRDGIGWGGGSSLLAPAGQWEDKFSLIQIGGLKAGIERECPGLSPCFVSAMLYTKGKLEFGWVILLRPPFSPDLSPFDYRLLWTFFFVLKNLRDLSEVLRLTRWWFASFHKWAQIHKIRFFCFFF